MESKGTNTTFVVDVNTKKAYTTLKIDPTDTDAHQSQPLDQRPLKKNANIDPLSYRLPKTARIY